MQSDDGLLLSAILIFKRPHLLGIPTFFLRNLFAIPPYSMQKKTGQLQRMPGFSDFTDV